MGVGWYAIGIVLSLVFYREGKDHWKHSQRFVGLSFWVVGAGMFARSVYKLVELL